MGQPFAGDVEGQWDSLGRNVLHYKVLEERIKIERLKIRIVRMVTGFSSLGSESMGRPNVVMDSRFPWQVFPSKLNGLCVAKHENW